MNAQTTIDVAKAAPAPDKIGAFPRDYDTDALPERRSAALARMMTIVATVSVFANVAQAFALAALLPLQKVVPMVVTSNSKGDEVIRIEPANLENPTSDYIAEISLRGYVQKRYAIVASAAEQAILWGPGSTVQLMSSPESYSDFMTKAKPEYDRLRGSQITRTVRIDSVRKLGEDTWQVEFQTTDQPDQNALAQTGAPATGQTTSWVSTFTITFEPKNVRYSDRLNNPFGMTVTSVSDARRD